MVERQGRDLRVSMDWSCLTMSPWVLFDDVYVSSDLWPHTPVPKSTCWHRPVQPLLWSLWSRNPVRSDLHQPSGWFYKSPKWRAPHSATLLTVARVCNGLVTAESFLMSLALEMVAGPVCTLYMCNYILHVQSTWLWPTFSEVVAPSI